MIWKTLIILTGFFFCSAFSQMQEVAGRGNVDWGDRVITAKGIGAPNPNMPEVTARPMAIQAARADALRNALELIKGIQITSSTTVENFMVTSDVIKKKVSGFIRTFQESEPKYLSDKTIEITVSVPMDEVFADALLPESISLQPKPLQSSTGGASKGFTGLIVDARGMGVVPALAPKIYDESGKEIYGSAYVSREFAVKWGMAGYAKDPAEAAKNLADRLGTKPGQIKALKAAGPSKCDIVISNQDAADVINSAKSQNFLADCKVVIIVD